MGSIFAEISARGIITGEYYEAVFSFLIFWFFLAQAFACVFSLLYYRKFVDN